MDYFSILPDALLFIIISFLPFKDAVRTSVLSRRWCHLWHATGNIDLDENFFVKKEDSDKNMAMQRTNFMHFIHHWMDNCQVSEVKRFRFVFPSIHLGSAYLSHAQRCVEFVTGFRVIKAVDIDFSSPLWDIENLNQNPQTTVPVPFFKAHVMLESLKLSACSLVIVQFKNFSALKNVRLEWIDLPGDTISNLIKMCPLLEVLSLKKCRNLKEIVISAEKLKVLVLDKCTEPVFITVDAPLLTTFKYYGLCCYMRMDYHSKMEEAVFDFGLQSEIEDEGDGEMLYNLLIEIFSVRVLTVCSYMLQVLPICEEPLSLLPRLENMRHLTLKTQLDINEFYGITFFLNSCPKLEVLEFDLGPKRIIEDYGPPLKYEEHPFLIHDEYTIVYKCVKRTLKTVIVKGFKGTGNEMVVLRYLLKFGVVLENLFVHLSTEKGANGIDMEAVYIYNLRRLVQSGAGSPRLHVYMNYNQD